MTGLSFDILGKDKASPAFDKVGRASDRVEKKFGFLAARSHGLTAGIATGFSKILPAMAAVATVEVFKDFINEARESRKVGALTEQVIKSTGGAAKISAKQVGDLATAISNKTGADDEAIQSGENLLLTFTNIKNGVGKGNDIFDQATQAITDMTAALNDGQVTQEGIKSSSIQLGKALNDPIKGVTALQKVGVSFTADQKKQIKTLVDSGKTMDAQKIILKELGKEFGGAAAAASDPLTKLSTIAGNAKEAIGGVLLPVVDKVATWLGEVLPVAIDKSGKFFNDHLLPPLKVVSGFIKDTVVPGVQGLYDLLVKHDFTGQFAKAFNIEEDSPMVGFLLRIGQGIEGVWNLLIKHDFTKEFARAFNVGEDSPVVDLLLKINEGVKGAPAAAKKLATGLIDGLATGLKTGDWSKLGGALSDGLISAIKGASSVAGSLVDAIGALVDKVDWGTLGSKVSGAITGMLESVDWSGLGQTLGDAVVNLFQKLGALSDKVKGAFKDLMNKVDWKGIGRDSTDAIGRFVEGVDWGKVAKTLAGAAIKSLKFDKTVYDTVTSSAADLVIGMAEEIGKAIGHWFAGAGTWLYGKGKELVAGLFSGAAEQGSGVGSWFQDHVISPVVGAFSGAGKWLVQHGRNLFTGLKNGITDAAKGVGDWIMRAPVAQVLAPFLGAVKWLIGPGKNVISGLLNGIGAAAKNIGNWIGRNVVSPVVGVFGKAGSWLVQHGKNLLAGFENGVAAIAKGIGSFFYSRVISPVVVSFSKAGSWLVQAGKNVVAGFTSGVSAFIASVKGLGAWFYNHVVVPAVTPFTKAGSWLVSHGKNLIAGLLSGISQDMKGIGKWIKVNVVDPIVSAVKNFFGIKSPSKVFEGIGGHLVAGLMRGLSKTSGAAIAKKVFGDMPSALRSIVGKGLVSVSNLPKKALDALGSSVGIGAPIGGPSGHTNNEGIVRTLAAQRGWGTGAEWDSLRALIMGESGFNSNAQNPTSSAYGIFQFLDSTWGSVGASKTSDPWAQTIAGLTYIARSYGDPINAYSKWSSRSPHWYANGGVINEPVMGIGMRSGDRYGFGERGPEMVFPTKSSSLTSLIQGKFHRLHQQHVAHTAHQQHTAHVSHVRNQGGPRMPRLPAANTQPSELTLTVAPGADSAVAQMVHKLVRSGTIQLSVGGKPVRVA